MTTTKPNESLLSEDLEHVLSHTRELWEEFRGGRIFIAGGTGFFGCWLLETFLHANAALGLRAEATVLTRNPRHFAERAAHLAHGTGIKLLAGSVTDFVFPPGEFSHVVNAAVEYTEPLGLFASIIDGTRRSLEFARAAGARRYLLTSSGAVYGRQPPELTHIPETYTGAPDPLARQSVYGEAKRGAETLCAAFSERDGIQATIARGFAFVGPYLQLDGTGAMGNFIADLLAGRQIRVKGDGTPYRSYLYAADLAIWLWTILCRAPAARAFNVGSPFAISIRELADTLVHVMAPGTPVETMPDAVRGQPAERYVPSIERARKELGLEVWIDLREGVRRTAEWWSRQQRP